MWELGRRKAVFPIVPRIQHICFSGFRTEFASALSGPCLSVPVTHRDCVKVRSMALWKLGRVTVAAIRVQDRGGSRSNVFLYYIV